MLLLSTSSKILKKGDQEASIATLAYLQWKPAPLAKTMAKDQEECSAVFHSKALPAIILTFLRK